MARGALAGAALAAAQYPTLWDIKAITKNAAGVTAKPRGN